MSAERWYEFEQHETSRAIYVKGPSAKEARRRLMLGDGVADYSPNFPDMDVRGRGLIVKDQSFVDDLAAERANE